MPNILVIWLRFYVFWHLADPVATVQDVQDQHRLQVNLRPYHTHHNPIMEFIAPSAPRLDLEDLPPSYEEAIKMTMSTQV